MKRRNQFLSYGRMFTEDTGAGGESENENNEEQSEEKEVDYKKVASEQKEQINLLMKDKELRDLDRAEREKKKEEEQKKTPDKKEKKDYMTRAEMDEYWNEKRKEDRLMAKLDKYDIPEDEKEKLLKASPEHLEIALKYMGGSKKTLPDTPELGNAGSSGSVTYNTVDEMLDAASEVK